MGERPLFVFLGRIGWVTVNNEDLVVEVNAVAKRVAGDFGLQIFNVQLRRESIGWVLRVILDRQEESQEPRADSMHESVSLDDCQRVSRDLSAVLDADVTFEHPYTLEVSSPGLDRPLRHLDDCRRFVGRLTKIVTLEAVDGTCNIDGRITAVDERTNEVVIDTERRVHRIEWSKISRAKLDIEF